MYNVWMYIFAQIFLFIREVINANYNIYDCVIYLLLALQDCIEPLSAGPSVAPPTNRWKHYTQTNYYEDYGLGKLFSVRSFARVLNYYRNME